MIDATHLRIGNWVNVGGIGNVQVTAADFKDWEQVFGEPIPLTPSILEKAGFTTENGNEYRIGLPLGNGTDLAIEVLKEETGPYDALITDRGYDEMPNLYSYVKCQRYIHQLQNLYFALTGAELEIAL